MTANKPQGSHVQAVEKALLLLELMAAENRALSLTEIAKAMNWPKSTTHGLLTTLRDYRYVDQSPETGHYGLGLRLFELGHQLARSWDIRTLARPVMQQLNQQLGEMVHLATEDKGEVLYLEKLDSTQMIRIVSEIGARLPMHCSGLGKVLLAYKNPAEVQRIVKQRGLKAMTNRTITTLPRLEQELARVREQGYAIDDREIMDSLRCVAAPIYDREGHVHYALSVSGLANSMQNGHFAKVLIATQQAAQDISYRMGYRPAEQTPQPKTPPTTGRPPKEMVK